MEENFKLSGKGRTSLKKSYQNIVNNGVKLNQKKHQLIEEYSEDSEEFSSYGSYSEYDLTVNSPTVRGFRCQEKKQKEDEEFNQFLKEQEELFESYTCLKVKHKTEARKCSININLVQLAKDKLKIKEEKDEKKTPTRTDEWDIITTDLELSHRSSGVKFNNFPSIKNTLLKVKEKFSIN